MAEAALLEREEGPVVTGRVLRLPQVGLPTEAVASTADAVAAFLADLEQAGRSPATRQAYASDLRLLTAACAPQLADVTPACRAA